MTWLSVDPGSYETGLVAWEGDTPRAWLLAECPRHRRGKLREWPIEKRIHYMVTVMVGFAVAHKVDTVAIEKPVPNKKRPAGDAETVYRRLKQECQDRGWEVHEYHPSTVIASVRPRGCNAWHSKAVLKTGVCFLYGMEWRDRPQDVIDACAVGAAHLAKLKEEALTS